MTQNKAILMWFEFLNEEFLNEGIAGSLQLFPFSAAKPQL